LIIDRQIEFYASNKRIKKYSVVKCGNDGLSTRETSDVTGIESYTVLSITKKSIKAGDIVNPDVIMLYKK